MKQRRRGGSAAKNLTLSRTRALGVRAGRAGVRVRGSAGGSAPWASGRRGWRRKLRRSRGRLRLGAIPARCHPSRRPRAQVGSPPEPRAAARPRVRAGPGLRRSETVLPTDLVGRPGTPRGPCQPLRVTLHAVSLGHSTPEPGRGGAEGSQPLALAPAPAHASLVREALGDPQSAAGGVCSGGRSWRAVAPAPLRSPCWHLPERQVSVYRKPPKAD